MMNLHRLSAKMSIEGYCRKLKRELQNSTFQVYPELEKHGKKQYAVPQYGNYGEEAWTAMNLDGAECTSVGVHVIGVMVGYCGYASNCTTPSRAKYLIDELELRPEMLPSLIRAAEYGSEVREPASKRP